MIIKKEWNMVKIIIIFAVMIDKFHSGQFFCNVIQAYLLVLNYFVQYGWKLHIISCLISCLTFHVKYLWRMSLTWKIRLSVVLLSVGLHLSLRPPLRRSPPTVGKFSQEVGAKTAMWTIFFHSFDFCEKHLQFCIWYLMGILKYSQNPVRQHQTLF